MKFAHIVLAAVAALGLLLGGVWLYYEQYANPRTLREIVENPDGERAQQVMVLTLPSRRQIPVNYLREGEMVYAGADGRWWRELVGEGAPVVVWIRGETFAGWARAERDDPEATERVFAKLRPNAIAGFGTLVEIRLGRVADPDPD